MRGLVLVCHEVAGRFCCLPGEEVTRSTAKLNRYVTGKAIKICAAEVGNPLHALLDGC